MRLDKQCKAARILAKLYLIRRDECQSLTVRDIMEKANDKEIDFYYHWFFYANNWRFIYV